MTPNSIIHPKSAWPSLGWFFQISCSDAKRKSNACQAHFQRVASNPVKASAARFALFLPCITGWQKTK
jgi:hypothetical protein